MVANGTFGTIDVFNESETKPDCRDNYHTKHWSP